MDSNPYQPPTAELVESGPAEATSEQVFYVVSPVKFFALLIGTFWFYRVYWYYRRWSQLNRRHRSYWPVPRAIFSIFFTHTLFREIDRERDRRRIAFEWPSS